MTVPEKCQQCGRLAFPGEAVTISSDEYQELLAFRKDREAAYTHHVSKVRLASRSRIARDPELAQFILQAAETMLIKEIVAACEERFGVERAPSRSSIHRFIHQA
ncbi:hypothetical protein ASD04_17875 [Devosia sp. Root436]|uniref:hypothetical protein n=1 Tax=Devosia sp. Root436 TaxID=1736537 RepID=UPI000700506E|nr:hypothetical protein [Devosia sp. Root436]KQX34110.1 hypothetical protein ASD04_17875 [Devosia sp. Root436]